MENNLKKGKNLKGESLKERQNEVAKNLATRDDNGIYYKEENPLVINENLKILEIKEKDVENETLLDLGREVRIVFQDEKGSCKSKEPYTRDIYVAESLEELEGKLSECSEEEDIEDLQL